MAADLLDKRFEEWHLHSRGGLYHTTKQSRDWSQYLTSITLIESVSQAARRADITLDLDPARTDPAHQLQNGADVHLYARTLIAGSNNITPVRRVFRGQVFNDGRDQSASSLTQQITVHDLATLLVRNEAALTFEDKSATEIVKQLCAEVGIPLFHITDTIVKVGQIVQNPGQSHWGVIQTALQRTFDKTGKRYVLRANDDGTALGFYEMGQTGIVWTVSEGPDGALTSAYFEDNAEDTRTELRIVDERSDDQGNTRTEVVQEREATGHLRDTFGRLRTIEGPENRLNSGDFLPENFDEIELVADRDAALAAAEAQAQAQFESAAREQADRRIKNLARTKKTLTTESLLIPGIRRGDRVNVKSSATGIFSRWYCDSVRQQVRAGDLSMTLELVHDVADVAS